MDPSIWARTPSGLTTVPTSMARVTFFSVTSPVLGSTFTWATQAVHVGVERSCELTQATPMPSFGPSLSRAVAGTAHRGAQRIGETLGAADILRLVAAGIGAGAVEQLQPHLHRILTAGVGDLVHGAFDRPEGPSRAPPSAAGRRASRPAPACSRSCAPCGWGSSTSSRRR